jgi:hypothetical protein
MRDRTLYTGDLTLPDKIIPLQYAYCVTSVEDIITVAHEYGLNYGLTHGDIVVRLPDDAGIPWQILIASFKGQEITPYAGIATLEESLTKPSHVICGHLHDLDHREPAAVMCNLLRSY